MRIGPFPFVFGGGIGQTVLMNRRSINRTDELPHRSACVMTRRSHSTDPEVVIGAGTLRRVPCGASDPLLPSCRRSTLGRCGRRPDLAYSKRPVGPAGRARSRPDHRMPRHRLCDQRVVDRASRYATGASAFRRTGSRRPSITPARDSPVVGFLQSAESRTQLRLSLSQRHGACWARGSS